MSDKFEIAERIKNSDFWDYDDCKELCRLAGLADEFKAADGEIFESVLFKAAEVLGVEII